MNEADSDTGKRTVTSLITRRNVLTAGIWIIIGTVLYFTSTVDYLLFHSIAETFSIAIAFTIFFIAWNTRHIISHDYLLFIGIAFLCIGVIDFFHMLSYKGMGVFGIEDANTATQLWIAARYVKAVSMLVAPLFLFRKLGIYRALGSYIVVTILILVSIFYLDIFPEAYSADTGLTQFKIISEYIISAALILSVWILYKNRDMFHPFVVRLIISFMLVSVASEMTFTLYTDVYGILNMTGHFLKILAYFLVYKAFIETGLRNPYQTIFRDLKASEESLEKINHQLEQEIEFRNETEQALLETEKDLNRAQEVAKLGNWRYDIQTGGLLWSDQTYDIFGIPKGQAVTYDYFLELVHPDDRENVNNEWQSALHGEDYDIEHRIVSGGEIKWVREIAELEFDKTGQLRGGFGTVQDITDIKNVEQIKDEFIGLVSHELRTPLTIIIGSLKSAVSSGISEEDMLEMIENATDGAESLAVILENMLELSRYQAGRLELDFKPVYLNATVSSVIKRLSAQKVTQDISVQIPHDLPPVKADSVRVERILHNLLENATKYSPPMSEIKVICREENGYIITQIVNQGEGISPEDIGNLFELFRRLPQSSMVRSGVGLGLVVCKRLVTAHGGWIKVTSDPAEGTVFSFALPAFTREFSLSRLDEMLSPGDWSVR